MRCRLGPDAVHLRREFGQQDTPFFRQMAQNMGVPPDRVRGATQELLLGKLSMAFLGTLKDMGVGAHMPADGLEKLR